MPRRILSDVMQKSGKKVLLLGNEAVCRGALEAGLDFATTYPGTPSSEVADTFFGIARKAGIYFEYSTNEKVAMEAAAGASFSGLKSIVSMKHFGLNVTADSFLPIAYVGTKGGMVVMVADDPRCSSSAQSEQDTRHFARMAHVPMFEPSTPQECKDFTKYAFELSKKYDIPVMLRTTTRVSHMRGVVKLGPFGKQRKIGRFVKEPKRFNSLPPHTMEMHQRILDKEKAISELGNRHPANRIVNPNSRSDWAIVTSSVSYNYMMEAMDYMKVKVPVLKLGLTWPLPHKMLTKFMKRFRRILVVEELETLLEKELLAKAKKENLKAEIIGQEIVPKVGEMGPESAIYAVCRMMRKPFPKKIEKQMAFTKKAVFSLPPRKAVLCPGCQHRAVFYEVQKVMGKDAVWGGDVGCYTLGFSPPFEITDFMFSMGASQGVIHGIKKATKQKAAAFIGDSTFFHGGMPGLLNIVYNKSDPVVFILDNRITAMTGHQPNPSTGMTGMGEQVNRTDIEKIVRSFGVENVVTMDQFNYRKSLETIREMLKKPGPKVIIPNRECHLLHFRKLFRAGIRLPTYQINQKECTKCGICLYDYACPAIYREKGRFKIDEHICLGCSMCSQICPANAIHPVMKKGGRK